MTNRQKEIITKVIELLTEMRDEADGMHVLYQQRLADKALAYLESL